ncbi:MAG: hypothetical protein KTR33_12865 [Gammaproteobacteria bacterium]|nr:hypothetical protein [Gammaproteobacteria bacterium]
MKFPLNQKFQILTGLTLGILVQSVSAHEGLLPHSHAADAGGVAPLVIVLVIAALLAAVAGWRLTRKRR